MACENISLSVSIDINMESIPLYVEIVGHIYQYVFA